MVTGQEQAAQMGRMAELREQLGVPLIAKPFTVIQILDAVGAAATRLVT